MFIFPISLLSSADKILERIKYNRQYEFLVSKNLIDDLQCGFSQKHSTFNAPIHLTNKIQEQLGKGNFGYRIFVGYQKAFDTDHNILIQKLNYHGVRGTTGKRQLVFFIS